MSSPTGLAAALARPFDAFAPAHLARLNPRMPEADRARLEAALVAALPAFTEPHLFLATSGTTSADPGALKWVALPLRAFRAGARAANACLQSGAHDTWLHALPDFHVGGLAIRARARLSGARVVDGALEWSAPAFVGAVEAARATLASLVPAQLHDLVQGGHRGPAGLRAVLLGGGALGPTLWREARALGWPILPTYGMTECGSQVATAALADLDSAEYPPLRLMPHLEAERGEDGRIRVRGASLLTAYVRVDGGVVDPRRDGWLATDDRGSVEGRILRVEGRTRDLIKVGAENVDLARLDRVLDGLAGAGSSLAVFAAPDERLGHVVHAASTDPAAVAELVAAFNAAVFPYERIRAIRQVPEIPRTELGKLRRGDLERLAFSSVPARA